MGDGRPIRQMTGWRILAMVMLLASAGAALAHDGEQSARRPVTADAGEQKPWGIAGKAGAVRRTISIGMNDAMRFVPDRIEVREGETVRLRLSNKGRQMHELVIGTKKELDEHAALMLKFPGMQHDEPWMAHVAPGKGGEIIWHFNRAGEFDFACLIAGHFQAGMLGKIRVIPMKGTTR